jgi:hypothetical protein
MFAFSITFVSGVIIDLSCLQTDRVTFPIKTPFLSSTRSMENSYQMGLTKYLLHGRLVSAMYVPFGIQLKILSSNSRAS